MVRNHEKLAAQKHQRQRPVEKDQEKHPQGVCKKLSGRPLRRSGRLQPQCSEDTEHLHHLPANKTLRKENRLTASQSKSRKRSREDEKPLDNIPTARLRKRPRTSACFTAKRQTDRGTSICSSKMPINPIDYWRREQTWPKEYFEPDNTMNYLLARRKSTPSPCCKRSEPDSLTASATTPSDQKPREEKSAPYKDARYETLLATKNSFMSKSKLGLTDASKTLCQTLLEKEQTVPEDSLFCDDLFEGTCEMIRNKNETRVIRDISLLIVPSAEILAARGAKPLKILIESVNEGWNNSIPLTRTRPQPDYSVGFRREAFTEDQLNKLQPFVGEITDTSYFIAIYYMYFPFLTCEVKCGAAALDLADRQNAHRMTLAVRTIVELFRLVKRENELHREILAFSISHDHRSVRIYGYYLIIEGAKTTFYRHPIRAFDFTDGEEKWRAYRFTKNVYDMWMPTLFKRICSH